MSTTQGTTLSGLAQVQGGSSALQAYRILLDALNGGAFEGGSRLPGERALAEQLGVSRATVRQVLTALAENGLLLASANRGWFVAERRLSEGPNVLRSFSETARDKGLTPGARVTRQVVRPATLDEAETLGLAPAADVLDVERLRTMDGVPVGVDYCCLPLARVPGLDQMDLTDSSLYEVLSQRYELVASRCDYEVQAEAASEPTANLLLVKPGFPVLIGYETTYDQHERPLITGRITFRGDAYRLKVSMFRS